MKVRIIADSSCDILKLDGVDFINVPLTISTNEKSYTDDSELDTEEMLNYLAGYHGRSYTACPGVESWLESFEGADIIYIATMTSALSGTYNSAMAAKNSYLETHPEAKIYVFDTLSTGPELRLFIEKLAELVTEGKDCEEVCREAERYLKRTRLFFSLESLHNFAQNGRVSKFTASAAGMLGIRIFGTASRQGTLEPLSKCRGEKRTLQAFMENLKLSGYKGGKLFIAHVENLPFAENILKAVREKYKKADIVIYKTRGLCSYYAERGGVLIGCECDADY